MKVCVFANSALFPKRHRFAKYMKKRLLCFTQLWTGWNAELALLSRLAGKL